MQKNIYIIGDSHAYDLKPLMKDPSSPSVFKLVECIAEMAKTAQGLIKKDNREIFLRHIKKSNRRIDYIGLWIGEVDCEFTIGSRMERHKTTEKEEILFAVKNLILLAKEVSAIHSAKVFFMGPIIPLVKDYSKEKSKLIRLRRQTSLPYEERTTRSLLFNQYLKKFAEQNRYNYLQINNRLLDSKTGVAKLEYQKRRNAHHLGGKISRDFWSDEITKMIKRDSHA
jgi:hypothetical protein